MYMYWTVGMSVFRVQFPSATSRSTFITNKAQIIKILNVQRFSTVYLHLMLDGPVRKSDFRYVLHVLFHSDDFKPTQSLSGGIARVGQVQQDAFRCAHHRIAIVLNVLVYHTLYN